MVRVARVAVFTKNLLCQPFAHNVAEYSFETNAAPVGGYVDTDQRQITAGRDTVLLQTMAWTDDFDDLPVTYQFGYTHGLRKVLSASR